MEVKKCCVQVGYAVACHRCGALAAISDRSHQDGRRDPAHVYQYAPPLSFSCIYQHSNAVAEETSSQLHIVFGVEPTRRLKQDPKPTGTSSRAAQHPLISLAPGPRIHFQNPNFMTANYASRPS